jgi:hypothetical protein
MPKEWSKTIEEGGGNKSRIKKEKRKGLKGVGL